MLQQMCAVLTRTEVNEHLRAICKQQGMLSCPLIKKNSKAQVRQHPKSILSCCLLCMLLQCHFVSLQVKGFLMDFTGQVSYQIKSTARA
jgi:hypothetical protein